MRCIVVYRLTAVTKPIPDESAGGQERAEMHAKAAESLCAACLTKSKKKSHTHCQNASGTLTDRKNAERSSLCEKQRCMRKCRLCRKRAKSACEGRCNADGKRVEQEKRASHSGSAGALRKGRGEEKKKRENPLIFLFQRVRTVDRFTGEIANFRLICRDGFNGRHICRPYRARIFLLPRRAG